MKIKIFNTQKHELYYKKHQKIYDKIIEYSYTFPSTIKPNTYSLILKDGNTVIGVARIDIGNIKKMGEECYVVRNVLIFPEFRGKGLCNKIMKNITNIQRTKYNKLPTLLLVLKSNISAIQCYENNGFVKDNVKYNVHDIDYIKMRLT
jgi:predicted GNAT family N-acyltransferase